jgi:hypothetical protein
MVRITEALLTHPVQVVRTVNLSVFRCHPPNTTMRASRSARLAVISAKYWSLGEPS